MAKAYMGKILWVDLTKGVLEEEDIPEETYKRFLAGYGLGAKILFDRMEAGVDPLGPDNVLGFVSGLLSGTGALFAGRWTEAVLRSVGRRSVAGRQASPLRPGRREWLPRKGRGSSRRRCFGASEDSDGRKCRHRREVRWAVGSGGPLGR